ncbi:M15 family metallopeptidase [Cohnella mopanensis]|uniref:M15 family metallopeptidase n=1 Tax=Cohnella mopanensis TaxID=2911966 RepID=UPI001EF978FC|nr:M15 family metallopeptidase [Cohnella mopanensis]
MNKKFAIAVILIIVVIGGVWTLSNRTSNPDSSDQATSSPSAPNVQPSSTPLPSEPAETHSAKPEPSKKPEPSATPTEKVDPPLQVNSIYELLANSLPSSTIKKNSDGLAVITNAESPYVLVNKKRNLPSDYVPPDLVVPDVPFSFSGNSPKKQMRKDAAKALESLFKAAEEDGIELKAVSGYRSYATQKSIFDNNAKNKGEEVANRTSARPGQSEHQTGLAMDISSASVGYGLEESFGDTKEGKWLSKHAPDHGFILRFLKGKEDITGYSYEPWHVRYVGKEIAKDITKKKVTLEQYYDEVAEAVNSK